MMRARRNLSKGIMRARVCKTSATCRRRLVYINTIDPSFPFHVGESLFKIKTSRRETVSRAKTSGDHHAPSVSCQYTLSILALAHCVRISCIRLLTDCDSCLCHEFALPCSTVYLFRTTQIPHADRGRKRALSECFAHTDKLPILMV